MDVSGLEGLIAELAQSLAEAKFNAGLCDYSVPDMTGAYELPREFADGVPLQVSWTVG
jgi:hypothetical protein